jgi:LacI family transcriptional regulator
LNYSPNLAARSLASADATRIGLLYSNPSAAYLSEFLVGSLEQSSVSGCQLVIEKCDGADSERVAIAKLVGTGADGIILPPPLCDSSASLQAVAEKKIPAVGVATGRPSPAISSVSIDDLEAVRAMTHYLIGLGHKRIGFIKGHPNQTASEQRLAGFKAAMNEAGLSGGAAMAQGYFSYRSGLAAGEKLLQAKERPTAIFASNDDMGAAAVSVAHRMGLDVPRDLSVVGYDDTPVAATVWPALTTVHQPIADMARAAVGVLLDQIRAKRSGTPAKPIRKLLGFTLVFRESSGRAPPNERS